MFCHLSLSSLSLLPLFIVTILAKPVWLRHQSLLLFSLLFPFAPPASPAPLLPFSVNYSQSLCTWIHLAQWRLNKCSCQTQTAWSQCRGVTKERVMKRENGRQINGLPLEWLLVKIARVSYKSVVIHWNKDRSPPQQRKRCRACDKYRLIQDSMYVDSLDLCFCFTICILYGSSTEGWGKRWRRTKKDEGERGGVSLNTPSQGNKDFTSQEEVIVDLWPF